MSAKTSKKASAKKSKALQNKTTTTIKSELKANAVVEKSAKKTFWQKQSLKAILGEFVGTMVFVTLATGDPYSGLGFSFGLAAIVMALFMISGGHVNPIVTIGLWSARKFEGAKVPFYVLAQLLGGFTSLLITRSSNSKRLSSRTSLRNLNYQIQYNEDHQCHTLASLIFLYRHPKQNQNIHLD